MQNITLGIIKETKTPPDKRVPLTPKQCRWLLDRYPHLKVLVQPSPLRCYSDDEYRSEGIPLSEDLTGCQVLMGVKEVKTQALMSGKSYLFFSFCRACICPI